MADTVLIETTQKVAGETHYFGEPLALGIIAALIVIGIICIAKMWHRRHSPNSSDSAVPDLHNPQKQKGEDPSSIIISSSWSSGEEHVYYPPPPPLQNGQKLKPLSINRVETKQQQQLQNVLPKLQETHFPNSSKANDSSTFKCHNSNNTFKSKIISNS
uniref:Uncharacterized protein n=1 Tax=Panagrolaimus superbus TaxID=310955 RepID=A0A914YU55_9BILA